MVGEWRIDANSSSVIIVDNCNLVSGVKIHYYVITYTLYKSLGLV